ncbi:phage N-6-adenine-methyltransferase [Photobacterium angustum]|uniref:phage N-6-adenine-methyltransferase n=1 Tax=Photobacterium angustum TaxID=661 RepID=UPI00069B7639|nr:phage N-6-adenine-methyltransferase [Photobacterium angustum]
MIIKSNTPNDIKDKWRTPAPVFGFMHREFNFGLDVCADDDNALLDNYLTEEDNALDPKHNWHELAGGRPVWCNPPYSRKNLKAFINEAKYQASVNGATIVMLIPNSVDATYFPHDAASEVRLVINGRINFNRADGAESSQNLQGSCFCILSPERGAKPDYTTIDASFFDRGDSTQFVRFKTK